MAQPLIFLSYSSADAVLASAIERALVRGKLSVFRDIHSVAAGTRWLEKIVEALSAARGVVVLATPASARSEWVTYEYAFAKGAGIPVVAVVTDRGSIPKPIELQFQTITYVGASETAKMIRRGLREQRNELRKGNWSTPSLRARFQEVDGEVKPKSRGKLPDYAMDLWVEGAPPETRKVAFEILDEGVYGRKWRASRKADPEPRDFLANDLSLYGDVEIWAQGIGSRAGQWTVKTTLFDSLNAYYQNRSIDKATRKALVQIRDN